MEFLQKTIIQLRTIDVPQSNGDLQDETIFLSKLAKFFFLNINFQKNSCMYSYSYYLGITDTCAAVISQRQPQFSI